MTAFEHSCVCVFMCVCAGPGHVAEHKSNALAVPCGQEVPLSLSLSPSPFSLSISLFLSLSLSLSLQ